MNLEDRVAVVTGGGTGIGRGISEVLAHAGAKVIVNYSRSRDDAEQTVAAICAQGGAALAIASDVSQDSEARSLMQRAAQAFGRLDILVNNAGWSTRIPHEKLDDLTDEIWDRTLNTNLRGAFYCMRAAVPYLKKQPGSCIVNIASVAALTGQGSSIAYAASKGGLLTMTKSFARILAPDVRVNAIAPGFVRTRFANWPQSAFDQGESITPLKKLPTPEEIGKLTLYLASETVPITGQTIEMDGGLAALGAYPART
ncbi:MAG TPA: glucose 1-dehydrogenase [Bryobacteraceae bacterium]|nr:glucose 1-dehydrogenase [Bryobacteraceae bacterium]